MKRLLAIAAFVLSCAFAHAQAVNPILVPFQTFVDADGFPCTGCSLYSYVAGTTTPKQTFVDSSGTTPNTNPIILDVAGGANVWLASGSYKFVLKSASGSTIWTVDNVSPVAGAASFPGPTNTIPKNAGSGVGAASSLSDNGTSISTSEPIASGCGTYCWFQTSRHTMTHNVFADSASESYFTKSIHADMKINGVTLNTDSASPNYNTGLVPPAGYTVALPMYAGPEYVYYVPTPSSPSSFALAYGNGPIFRVLVDGTTTSFSMMGDKWTHLGTSTAGVGVTSTTPYLLNSTSVASSGSAAGWQGNGQTFSDGYPILKTFTAFSASSDYATTRAWIGFCHGCSASVLNSDTPAAASLAMIRYSTVAGDAVWQCVTSNGTSQTVTPIASATPGTTGSLKEIDINNGSVVCKVGANSATNTTNLPLAVSLLYWATNITQSSSAVNIRVNGAEAYYQGRGN